MFASHPRTGFTSCSGALRHCFPWRPRLPSPGSTSPWGVAGVSRLALPNPRPSSHLIGSVCGDVAGLADRTPSAGRRGGVVRHPGLCYLVASSPGHRHILTTVAQSRVPAAATTAAMVSPVTVVSEQQASEPVFCAAEAPRPGGCTAAAKPLGPRRGGDPAEAASPAGGGHCQGLPAPRPTAPFLRAPGPSVAGRDTVGT